MLQMLRAYTQCKKSHKIKTLSQQHWLLRSSSIFHSRYFDRACAGYISLFLKMPFIALCLPLHSNFIYVACTNKFKGPVICINNLAVTVSSRRKACCLVSKTLTVLNLFRLNLLLVWQRFPWDALFLIFFFIFILHISLTCPTIHSCILS